MNANGLSRLPLQCGKPECQSTSADAAFVIGQVQALPVTAERPETATQQDSLLVHLYVREGWPSGLPDEFKPYLNHRQEISTEGDGLMWGNRVVIP